MSYRRIEHVLMGLGLTLCFSTIGVLAYRELGARMAVRLFQAAAAGPAAQEEPPREAVSVPDYSLWGAKRIAAFQESLKQHFAPPVAILRIPKLRIEVPVFDGTDEPNLNRGVGRIIGTARAGENGNIGIAGHRDGFFRGLKDIKVGDRVDLSTAAATTIYEVDQIEIVRPEDVRVLAPRPAPSVTLTTCYPFFFIGDAPQRFIVHATLKQRVDVNKQPQSGSASARTGQL